MSWRELRIRKAGMPGQAPSNLPPDDHADFRTDPFSVFMHFTGHQGALAKVFALHRADTGVVHVLLFVLALELKLAKHTVVFRNPTVYVF